MEYYGGFYGPDPRLEIILSNQKRERKEIRRLSLLSGGAILLYILLQNLMVLGLRLTGLYALYLNSALVQAGVDCILTMVCFLLPLAVLARPMRAVSGVKDPLPLGPPNRPRLFLLAIPAGLGACMLVSRLTSYLIYFLSVFGLRLSSPDLPMPGGAIGVAVSFVRIVVIAALCEELCFRGYIMQNLRRYGDGFAIVMSAVVFGLMHGNLIQAPFALGVGLALGYFSVKTGTLWTGIVIHAINNSISLASSYLLENADTATYVSVDAAVTSVLFWSGVVCFVLFKKQRKRLAPGAVQRTWNRFGAKAGAFFSSPTMLLSILLMLLFTAQYVEVRA